MLPLLPPSKIRELGSKFGIRQQQLVNLVPFSEIKVVKRRYSVLKNDFFG